MKLLKVLLGLVLTISFMQASDVKGNDDFGALWKKQVKAAKAEIKQISPDELMRWNIDKKKFVLVDVREEKEVLAGWIEADTVKKIPRGILDVAAANSGALKENQTIVVYCKKGARGALAAKMLKDLGFKNVYNLDGGIHAWMNAGLPIVSSLGTFKTVPYELTGCGM